MKNPLIISNWKLNGNKHTILKTLNALNQIPDNLFKHITIVIAPPMIYLDTVQNYLINSHIKLCAQNVDVHLSGAFTGEISALMLKDLGIQYVIIGHSERRKYHQENDLYIAKKLSVLKEIGLIPILCIGENKTEYDSGCAKSVCKKQINTIIKHLGGIQCFKNTIIAYEPIWAIGSGLNAAPEYVQSIHKSIRDYIQQHDPNIANQIFIQYGGSVNTNNVIPFISQQDIDGVLIGTASLNTHNFIKIIQSIAEQTI